VAAVSLLTLTIACLFMRLVEIDNMGGLVISASFIAGFIGMVLNWLLVTAVRHFLEKDARLRFSPDGHGIRRFLADHIAPIVIGFLGPFIGVLVAGGMLTVDRMNYGVLVGGLLLGSVVSMIVFIVGDVVSKLVRPKGQAKVDEKSVRQITLAENDYIFPKSKALSSPSKCQRTMIFSDIEGRFDLFKEMTNDLNEVADNKEICYIFLGDFFDPHPRAPNNVPLAKALRQFVGMIEQKRFRFAWGNRDLNKLRLFFALSKEFRMWLANKVIDNGKDDPQAKKKWILRSVLLFRLFYWTMNPLRPDQRVNIIPGKEPDLATDINKCLSGKTDANPECWLELILDKTFGCKRSEGESKDCFYTNADVGIEKDGDKAATPDDVHKWFLGHDFEAFLSSGELMVYDPDLHFMGWHSSLSDAQNMKEIDVTTMFKHPDMKVEEAAPIAQRIRYNPYTRVKCGEDFCDSAKNAGAALTARITSDVRLTFEKKQDYGSSVVSALENNLFLGVSEVAEGLTEDEQMESLSAVIKTMRDPRSPKIWPWALRLYTNQLEHSEILEENIGGSKKDKKLKYAKTLSDLFSRNLEYNGEMACEASLPQPYHNFKFREDSGPSYTTSQNINYYSWMQYLLRRATMKGDPPLLGDDVAKAGGRLDKEARHPTTQGDVFGHICDLLATGVQIFTLGHLNTPGPFVARLPRASLKEVCPESKLEAEGHDLLVVGLDVNYGTAGETAWAYMLHDKDAPPKQLGYSIRMKFDGELYDIDLNDKMTGTTAIPQNSALKANADGAWAKEVFGTYYLGQMFVLKGKKVSDQSPVVFEHETVGVGSSGFGKAGFGGSLFRLKSE
jgi:hypothetical protein